MPDPGSPWERENPADGLGYIPQRTEADYKPSPYARMVVARGPEAVMKELDRLQCKIGEATRALRSVSTGGMLEAMRILER